MENVKTAPLDSLASSPQTPGYRIALTALWIPTLMKLDKQSVNRVQVEQRLHLVEPSNAHWVSRILFYLNYVHEPGPFFCHGFLRPISRAREIENDAFWCGAGEFYNTDNNCGQCAKNSYKDTIGDKDCSPCPADTETESEGASVCIPGTINSFLFWKFIGFLCSDHPGHRNLK